MENVITMKRTFARLLLIVIFTSFGLPLGMLNISTYKATESSTTEAGTTVSGNNLGNVNVEMSNNGGRSELNITGLDGDATNTWNTIFARYHGVIIGIAGVCTLTFIVFFIINITKLGGSTGNPNARSEALKGVLWTGIAAAACGSVTLIASLFWNALK